MVKPKIEGISTEDKIIEAARKVFTEKGFSATRTRDIAEEAGINLALLNYYFRSKEKLFQLVMKEKMQQFFSVVLPVVNNDKLLLDKKLEILSENYINLLIENPNLPIFILSEVRNNPEGLKIETKVQSILRDSSLVRQIKERNPNTEPIQLIVSIIGMTVFPFIAKPILFSDNNIFNALMEERKTLLVKWAKAIIDT